MNRSSPAEVSSGPGGRGLVGESAPPVLAALHRCIDGRHGRLLLQEQAAAREAVSAAREAVTDIAVRTRRAVDVAHARQLGPGSDGHRPSSMQEPPITPAPGRRWSW